MRSIIKSLHAPLLMQNKYNFGSFSNPWIILAGPYNPYKYKEYLVPNTLPSNQEIYNAVRNHEK